MEVKESLLVKELEARKKALVVDPSNLYVKEAKLLMEAAAADDLKIIKDLNLDSSIIEAEKATGICLERQKLDNTYDGLVFSYEEIKQLAIDYRLRFLQTSYYKGKLDVEVFGKVKDFCKKHDVQTAHDKDRFFILGPAECFQLQNRPKPEPRNIDPLLFYRIGDRNGDNHYKLIHKWGNDFSIWRYATSFCKRSGWHSTFHWFFMIAFILATFMISTGVNVFGSLIFSVFMGFVISFGVHWGGESRESFGDRRFQDAKWNTNWK